MPCDRPRQFFVTYGLQNSLGDAGVDMGDTLPLSLETTEEQMLSFMLSGIPQEFGGGWESTTPEEVSFAGKDYLSQTWRIGAETENGQTVVMYPSAFLFSNRRNSAAAF